MIDALDELIAAIDGFEFAGLRSEVSEVTASAPDTWAVTGTVRTGGISGGRLALLLFRAGNGRKRAFLQLLTVEPELQGHGFGTAFAEHLEDACVKASFDELGCNNSEVGSYTAARRHRAYEFVGDARAQALAIWNDHGQEALAEAQASGGLPAVEAARVTDLFASLEHRSADPPCPADIAELGEAYPWADGRHTMWLGKRILIGARWSGVKSLARP